jgi:ABC-type nitrate/sulfonate/bicarbonate transport system substrate-binding protein
MIGVGILESAGIKKPDDPVGKKMAKAPACAELPFLAACAQPIGIDPKSAVIVDVDPKPVERILASDDLDAMTGVASSSQPALLSQHRAARRMLYFSACVPTCGTDIVSSQAVASTNKGRATAVVDAVLEGFAFTPTNLEKSAGILFKAAAQAAVSASAKNVIGIAMGLQRFAVAKPAAMEHRPACGNSEIYGAVTGLVMTYLSGPGMARPAVANCSSNAYVANIKLTAAKWPQGTADVGEFGKCLP